MHTKNSMRMHKKIPEIPIRVVTHFNLLKANLWLLGWVGGTIDMLNFTFFI